MNDANKIILRCKNLNKSFYEGKLCVPILKDIQLSLFRGERLAILGASGAGKSTLLHMLGGLDHPTHGEIWINGIEISALSESQKSRLRNRALGFIYQFHHILPEFTALENVEMPLFIAGIKPVLARKKAKTVLDAVGLNHRYAHRLGELSGGERQRVAIARALVNEPTCILADEPTGNLDHDNAEKIIQLMMDLHRRFQTSLVVVTHDAKLAAQMDRSVTMIDGSLKTI